MVIFTKLSEYPTNSNLEGIAVSMIEDTFVVVEVVLPLDARMDGIVVVEVKSRAGRQGLGFVVLEMKVGFPENRSV